MIITYTGLWFAMLRRNIPTKGSQLWLLLYFICAIPLVGIVFTIEIESQLRLVQSFGSILSILVLWLWLPTMLTRYHLQYKKNFKKYRQLLAFIIFFSFLYFNSQNILSLFIYFELSTVPILLLIYTGGKSGKKVEAGFFLIMFTGVRAFIFLVFLIVFRSGLGVYLIWPIRRIQPYNLVTDPSNSSNRLLLSLVYTLTTIVILVKTPLYTIHIWLPKAHVEAPVFGSIVLARLLLKTGGYGYLILSRRFMGGLIISDWFISVILVVSIAAALSCSAQLDMKALIAYSRVNHIGLILLGIILATGSSSLGAVVLMVGHGIISSALFFLASNRYNQSLNRRSFFSIRLEKTNSNIFFWLIFVIFNAGLPPFLIFLGEIYILKLVLIYPFLLILCMLNYLLVGYYRCVILIKFILSKWTSLSTVLSGVGIAPFKIWSVLFIHLFLFVTLGRCNPWSK